MTHPIPTWKDYCDWCNWDNRNPFNPNGGNFTFESATDERIGELWDGTVPPGEAVTAFFAYWNELPKNEFEAATQRWQKFFDS